MVKASRRRHIASVVRAPQISPNVTTLRYGFSVPGSSAPISAAFQYALGHASLLGGVDVTDVSDVVISRRSGERRDARHSAACVTVESRVCVARARFMRACVCA